MSFEQTNPPFQNLLQTVFDNLPSGGGGIFSSELIATSQLVIDEDYNSQHLLSDQAIQCDSSIWTADKILFVYVHNHDGLVDKSFIESFAFIFNLLAANNQSGTLTSFPKISIGLNSSSNIFGSSTGQNGVYVKNVYSTGKIEFSAAYSASYGHIVGTYDVYVYLLTPSDDIKLFA